MQPPKKLHKMRGAMPKLLRRTGVADVANTCGVVEPVADRMRWVSGMRKEEKGADDKFLSSHCLTPALCTCADRGADMYSTVGTYHISMAHSAGQLVLHIAVPSLAGFISFT